MTEPTHDDLDRIADLIRATAGGRRLLHVSRDSPALVSIWAVQQDGRRTPIAGPVNIRGAHLWLTGALWAAQRLVRCERARRAKADARRQRLAARQSQAPPNPGART